MTNDIESVLCWICRSVWGVAILTILPSASWTEHEISFHLFRFSFLSKMLCSFQRISCALENNYSWKKHSFSISCKVALLVKNSLMCVCERESRISISVLKDSFAQVTLIRFLVDVLFLFSSLNMLSPGFGLLCFFFKMYLLMAVLALLPAWCFHSCSEWGLLFSCEA